MEGALNKIKAFVTGESKEYKLPLFTQETGIVRITNLEDLEKFINFLAPNDLFGIKTYQDLKYIEIRDKAFQGKYSVRIVEEEGKLKMSIHDVYNTYEEDTDSKSFEKGDISGMSEKLPPLVQKAIPNVEYSLWLQGKPE